MYKCLFSWLQCFFFFLAGKEVEGEAPHFIQPLVSVEVVEGNSASLQCKLTGKPEPRIEWFKGDVNVKDIKRIKCRFDGELATLKIMATELDDEADYKCVAENDFGSASCTSELLVNEPATKPDFKEKMKPFDVTEGEPATFSVKVIGHPPAIVDWFHGKDKMEDEGRVHMVDDEETGSYSLTINNTVLEDAGVYKCVAVNEEGQATCKAALAVKEKLQKPDIEIEEAKGTVVVSDGDVVSLNATVKGKPEPTVQWYKDDQKLRKTSRLKMDAKNGEVSLVILDAKPGDSGLYKCEATNKAGSAKRTFDVNIPGMRHRIFFSLLILSPQSETVSHTMWFFVHNSILRVTLSYAA